LERKVNMKYKQVFLIWFLADVFLALGVLAFCIYEQFNGGSTDDLPMFLGFVVYGTLVSLPSLCVMLLFHFVYSKTAKDITQYRMPYIALIIFINILYLLIGEYGFGMTPEFNIFYLGSTAAGLLAFYFVDRKIKKKTVVVNDKTM